MKRATAVILLACAGTFSTVLCAQQQGTTPASGNKTSDAPSAANLPELKTRTGLPLSQAEQEENASDAQKERGQKADWVVPAGTKIPVQLRQAISTKNAQPGDPIYGQTTFPIFVNQQVMIPGGTFVQGVVDKVKRAGRIKGTAELQFHLTTLLYPNGYMVDMTAPIDQIPGDENSKMKEPGTVKHDSEKGKDMERIGTGASQGAAIGTIAGLGVRPTLGGVRAGGLAGLAGGTLIGLLARGGDVRFETGTVVDVVLNQPIALDEEKIMRVASVPAYYPTQMQYPVPMQSVPPKR
ncbi:MAG TPA: hypothetical protein VFM10_03865 [Terriglobales bacterium]|jgi:type IV secretion system protein VirB10|nr:hypothetical protein [Terriglobales bacterium]